MTGTPGAGEGGPETGGPVIGGPATGAALGWCHARLRAGSAGAEDPEDRATVRSMPIVLHIPKPERPARSKRQPAPKPAPEQPTKRESLADIGRESSNELLAALGLNPTTESLPRRQRGRR